MMRKTATAILAAIVLASLAWPDAQARPAAASGKAEAGYVLLDRILVLFQNLARTSAGSREAVENGLEAIFTEAVQAKAGNQVDPVFFRRFNRLLTVMRLSFLSDPKGILKTHIDRVTADFVEDVTGRAPALDKGEGVGLGLLAGALADEIANLRIVLETRERKAKILNEWLNSFPAGK